MYKPSEAFAKAIENESRKYAMKIYGKMSGPAAECESHFMTGARLAYHLTVSHLVYDPSAETVGRYKGALMLIADGAPDAAVIATTALKDS